MAGRLLKSKRSPVRRLSSQRQVNSQTTAEVLANTCAQGARLISKAGRALHDNTGPLISAAGLRLQILAMDHPAAAAQVSEITEILDQAVTSVRSVSQDLHTSPVYRGGLKTALSKLLDQYRESHGLDCNMNFLFQSPIPVESAEGIYEAVAAALRAAYQAGATRISLTVRGLKRPSLRLADNGVSGNRPRALEPARLLARESGVDLRCISSTKRSTIVSIQPYAI
jgi:signal transduction histidine kinase